MEILEKKNITLNTEKCEDPISKEEKYNIIKQKLHIDLNNIEDEEHFIKVKDFPRRKSSTGSTSVSKPEESSELFSNLDSPVGTPLIYPKNQIFFGRDRNCTIPIFNFYQNTEENFRETHPEGEKYTGPKTQEIVLKTNGGISYNWEYTIENTDIIGIEDEKSEEKSHEVVGGEIEKHFILKGLKEGTTTIKFKHRNFVDNSINKTKEYTVKVNKKLEIFIKEIK